VADLRQKTAKPEFFKLVQAAAKTRRRLKGANQLPLVIEGVTFTGGVAANDTKNRAARSRRVTRIPAWLRKNEGITRPLGLRKHGRKSGAPLCAPVCTPLSDFPGPLQL